MLKKLLIAAIFYAISTCFTSVGVSAMKEEKKVYNQIIKQGDKIKDKAFGILERYESEIKGLKDEMKNKNIPSLQFIADNEKMSILEKIKDIKIFMHDDICRLLNDNDRFDLTDDEDILNRMDNILKNFEELERNLCLQHDKERKLRTGPFEYEQDKAREFINTRDKIDTIVENFTKIEKEIRKNSRIKTQETTQTKLKEIKNEIDILINSVGYNLFYKPSARDDDKKLTEIRNKLIELIQ